MGVDEQIALIRPLLPVGSGSHYQAARDGWSRPASLADILTQMNAVRLAAFTGSRLELDWPWDQPEPAAAEVATREEYAAANAALEAGSAYRGEWPTPDPEGGDN